MAILYAPPAVCAPPSRGVLWVIRAAGATLAIAAWLVILLHLLLLVRAEIKLAEISRQANAFAELPHVTEQEVAEFAHRRLSHAGYRSAKVHLAPRPDAPRHLQVERIEINERGVAVSQSLDATSPFAAVE